MATTATITSDKINNTGAKLWKSCANRLGEVNSWNSFLCTNLKFNQMQRNDKSPIHTSQPSSRQTVVPNKHIWENWCPGEAFPTYYKRIEFNAPTTKRRGCKIMSNGAITWINFATVGIGKLYREQPICTSHSRPQPYKNIIENMFRELLLCVLAE